MDTNNNSCPETLEKSQILLIASLMYQSQAVD